MVATLQETLPCNAKRLSRQSIFVYSSLFQGIGQLIRLTNEISAIDRVNFAPSIAVAAGKDSTGGFLQTIKQELLAYVLSFTV